MADVKDWGAFVRGRWDWTRHGYEAGFPRGCQFTDVDAAVEFNGRSLMIEAKHYDGVGDLPPLPSRGQMMYLQDEVRRGKAVLIVFGCGPCNDPQAIYDVGAGQLYDWRGLTKDQRRILLKYQINYAMGVNMEPS